MKLILFANDMVVNYDRYCNDTVQFMSMLKITSEYLRSDLIKGDPHG